MKDDERDYCDFYMQTCLETLTNKYRITLRIVLYGPSGAGKTSILKLIKTLNLKDVLSTVPSVTVEREIKKLLLMKLIFFALPGQKRYLFNREMLVKYLSNADALFYVVDSANPASFRFARIMLHHTLSILATLGKQIPIFILANKQDLPNALPIAVIRDSIWSPLMKEFPDIKVYFFAVSVLNPTTVNKEYVKYDSILPPFGLVEDKILQKVSEGNEIVVKDKSVGVLKDGEEILKINRPALLLKFE